MNTRPVTLLVLSAMAWTLVGHVYQNHPGNVPRSGKESPSAAQIVPLETTVCEIAQNPSEFNDKLVRVRGHVSTNFEYSTIEGDGCPDQIWFAYGLESGAPGLVAIVPGGARPGTKDANGNFVPPIKVNLIHDVNSHKFERLITDAVKADRRSDRSLKNEMVIHRVTATFVGRIDGVSAEIHAIHLKKSPMAKADYLGFGQMGLFDAQLVVKSVENDAVKDIVRIR